MIDHSGNSQRRLELPWSSHAMVFGGMLLLVLVLIGVTRSSSGASVWQGWIESVELRKPVYAERVRTDELFRTRANTWSNLAFVLVGFYAFAFGWRDRQRTGLENANYLIRTPAMSFLFGAACCYLGFGSGLFHASMTRVGQQLDVAAMYAPLLVLIAIGVGRWRPVLHWGGQARGFPAWPVLCGIVLIACSLLYQYKWSMRADIVLPLAILALLAFVMLDRFQSRWRLNVRWMLAGIAALVAAVVCRQLDVAGQFSGPDSWFQGHAWWHLLTSLSLACIYLYHRSELPLDASLTASRSVLEAGSPEVQAGRNFMGAELTGRPKHHEHSCVTHKMKAPIRLKFQRLRRPAIQTLFISCTVAYALATDLASTDSSDAMPPDIRIERGVAYLPADRAETADLYFPADIPPGTKLPAVIMIHGGGWNGGQRDGKRELNVCTTLAQNGYVAMSIDYLLTRGRGAVWPTNLWDCKTAVRWLRVNAERLQIDPDRIGVIGGSAGGHLAAMVALTTPADGLDPATPYGDISCAVSCCVDLYGIADIATYHDVKMLGKTVAEAPDLYRLASPITYVRSNSPPFLILHGTADTTVNVDQSERFAAALEKAGAKPELVTIPGAKHTFDLQPPQRDLRPLAIEFFDEHLKRANEAGSASAGRSDAPPNSD